MKKSARPSNRQHIADGMKMHLRVRSIGSKTLRIISPRPSLDFKISNNLFHDTWHFLGNQRTAKALAHFLWGLSYQTRENTVFLIHHPHLTPNPFDAQKSAPILFVPAFKTHLNAKEIKQLTSQLKTLGPSDQTVRWRTYGLENHQFEPIYTERDEWVKVEKINQMLVYTAPPLLMRRHALQFNLLKDTNRQVSSQNNPFICDYSYIDGRDWAEGEVQIFPSYDQLLSSAQRARKELEEEGVDLSLNPEQVRWRQLRILKRR